MDLRKLVCHVAAGQPVAVETPVKQQALGFVAGRFDNWLSENLDAPRDVISAVLIAQAHNPYRALLGIKELSCWVAREDWEAILDSFARCVRITKSETPMSVRPDLISTTAEDDLYRAVASALGPRCASPNVDSFLTVFEPMIPAVSAFFDKVLVHDPDPQLRNNRIALLQLISGMQAGIVDLSELENF